MFGLNSQMKSNRSGKLGEAFCKEYFGISEPRVEIKSISSRASGVIIQVWQLLDQIEKQYVIIKYDRAKRSITRGENKGKPVYIETIEQAYKKKVSVYVIYGFRILKYVVENKLTFYCTAKDKDILTFGKWGIVLRLPFKCLPDDIYKDNDRYTLYAYPNERPIWESWKINGPGTFNFDRPISILDPEEPTDEVPF